MSVKTHAYVHSIGELFLLSRERSWPSMQIKMYAK